MKALFCSLLLSIGYLAYCQDWPNLGRYASDNEKLLSDPIPKDRVVFMGNSITYAWIGFSAGFFSDNHFINRGIGGQTSGQMLSRFRADVIALRPKAVVIECGTNDIAENTGPSALNNIRDNITSMAELAKYNKIKVIIGSVLPANRFPKVPDVHPADSIIALNVWLKDYAARNNFGYIDYHSSLVDDQKGLKKEFSEDGVHPNKAGYEVMEKLALPVIRKIIR